MNRWLLLVFLVTASIQPVGISWAQARSATPTRPSPAKPAKIRISGFVNQCYKPNKMVVFVTSLPQAAPHFESRTIVLRADGRFTFDLDATSLTPRDYILNFGGTKRGAGGQRFTIKADTTAVDLGEIGDCDV